MGRREKPLEMSSPAIMNIARGMRELRIAAGSPPYRVLARRSGYSASALSQAASGSLLPSLEITLAYVTACGGDITGWPTRWHAAAAHQAGVTDKADPTTVVDVPSLAHELTKLVHQAGFHSLRAAVTASLRTPAMALSRATLGRALQGEVLPTEDVLGRMLRLCAVPADQHDDWFIARITAQLNRRGVTGNVVPINLPRPADHDPAIALGNDLRQLAKGRGLESMVLDIGPAIRQLCNLDVDDPPHVVRTTLTERLRAALPTLPEDLRLVAAAGFSLDTEIRGRQFLRERLAWCAEQLLRDQRTVRRRFDEATYQLAQRLLAATATDMPHRARHDQG